MLWYTWKNGGCLTRLTIIFVALMALPLLCCGGYFAERELRYQWAVLAYYQGDAEGAIKQLDHLNNYRDSRRRKAEFQYNEGLAAMERGDWDTARGFFRGSSWQSKSVLRKLDEIAILEDPQHKRVSTAFPLTESPLYDLVLSADGRLAVVSFGNTTIAIWDVQNRLELARLDRPPSSIFQYVALSPDGELVAISSEYGPVYMWHWRDNTLLWEADLPAFDVLDLAFSSDGATLNVLGEERSRHIQIRRWRVNDGAPEEEIVIPDQYGYAQAGAISPDGQSIALMQGTISIRSIPSGRVLGTIPCNSCYLRRIAFSPDSQNIIFSYFQGQKTSIERWQIGNQAPLQAITHDTEIYAVDINREGTIITGTESGMLIFWQQPDEQMP